MFDPQLYRDKAEIEQLEGTRPDQALRRVGVSSGLLHKDDVASIEKDEGAEIEQSVAFAEERRLGAGWRPERDVRAGEGAVMRQWA